MIVRAGKILFAGVFLALFFSSSVFALEVPPPPDTYVTDKAGLLSPALEAKLELALANFEEATSNQVVIATFPSLEGESLEDFSIRLAERWKVGDKDKNNGVIILIFSQDRKMRIEVGYGLEGALPDALSGQIIQNVFLPNFKTGDYEKGILEGTRAVLKAVQGEYKGAGKPGGGKTFSSDDAMIVMFFFAAIIFFFLLDTGNYFGIYRPSHRSRKDSYSFWEWWFRFSILLFILNILLQIASSGKGSSVGGSGGSSGGGFSGGGGSFGGGGSSGSW